MARVSLRTSSRGRPDQPHRPTVVAPGVMPSWAHPLGHVHAVALRAVEQSSAPAAISAHASDAIYQYVKAKDGSLTVSRIKGGELQTVSVDEVQKAVEDEGNAAARVAQGTSFAAEYVTGIVTLIVDHLHGLAWEVPREQRPRLIKALLERMARPLSGYEVWEQGQGLVTLEIAREYLATLTEDDVRQTLEQMPPAW
jgi:hypothetical protein